MVPSASELLRFSLQRGSAARLRMRQTVFCCDAHDVAPDYLQLMCFDLGLSSLHVCEMHDVADKSAMLGPYLAYQADQMFALQKLVHEERFVWLPHCGVLLRDRQASKAQARAGLPTQHLGSNDDWTLWHRI